MGAHDSNPASYAAIFDVIRDWPVEERLAFMHDILRTLVPADGVSAPKNTWEQANRLLAGPWPAPSDEDIERKVDESQQEERPM